MTDLKLQMMEAEIERLKLIVEGVNNSNSQAELALEEWYLQRVLLTEMKEAS